MACVLRCTSKSPLLTGLPVVVANIMQLNFVIKPSKLLMMGLQFFLFIKTKMKKMIKTSAVIECSKNTHILFSARFSTVFVRVIFLYFSYFYTANKIKN